MGILGRLGKGAWKLNEAADEAPETPEDVAAVEEPLTTQHATLLLRYIAARSLVGWLFSTFLVVYGIVAVFLLLGLVVDQMLVVGVAVVLLLIAALIHWRLRRRVSRLGMLRQLAGLEDLAGSVTTSWWPKLLREMDRVKLASGPLGVLQLLPRLVARRMTDKQRAAFDAIDWTAVLPRSEWRQARRLLAEAAATQGS